MAKASQVVILENEFYIIKAPNGKVLEVKDFNTENGAAIQLWSYAGHPWQQWQFVDAGGGRWRIQNRFTGKVIDLALGGVVEGTWLHQWSRTNGWSQCWTLEPTRSGQTVLRPRSGPMWPAATRNGIWCASTRTPPRRQSVRRKSRTPSPRQASASIRMIWCAS